MSMNLLYRTGQLEADKSARELDLVASTDALGSDGAIIASDQWDLERYQRNPVVLYGHGGMPIGYAKDVRVDKHQLRATAVLADAKANTLAEQVYHLARQGALRGVSVGFRAHGARTSEGANGQPVVHLERCELFEISIVAMPANPETVIEAVRAAGGTFRPSANTRAPLVPDWETLAPIEKHQLVNDKPAVAAASLRAYCMHHGKTFEQLTEAEAFALQRDDFPKWRRMANHPNGADTDWIRA